MNKQDNIDPYKGTTILWTMPGVGHTTMERKQLRAFLLATGGSILAQGRLWDIKSTHLGAGIYKVTTKRND
jgi:hypothetical protein